MSQTPFWPLPWELLRPIIEFATEYSSDWGYPLLPRLHDTLQLRLVNSHFNREVLRAVVLQRLPNLPSPPCRMPWHQCISPGIAERYYSSVCEFVARCVFERLDQRPRGCVFYFINYVLDEVLDRAGRPRDHPCRREWIRIICKRYLTPGGDHPTPLEYMADGYEQWIYTLQPYLHKLYCTDWFGNWYFRPEALRQPERLDFLVAVAQLQLGNTHFVQEMLDAKALPCWYLTNRHIVFHRLLPSAVLTGDVAFVRRLFEEQYNPINVADEEHPLLENFSSALVAAVQTGNLDMVKLICEPPPGHPPHPVMTQLFQLAAITAIAERHLPIYWYLRGRVRQGDKLLLLFVYGLQEASHFGDDDVILSLLDLGHAWEEFPKWATEWECTPLEFAARAGHVSTVRLLLSHGIEPSGRPIYAASPREHQRDISIMSRESLYLLTRLPYKKLHRNGGAMLGAALYGHVEIADLLLQAGIFLDHVEWEHVVLGAVERQQTSFLAWLLQHDLIPEWKGVLEPPEVLEEIEGSPPNAPYVLHRYRTTIKCRPDLLAHTVVWGTPPMVRMLAAAGWSLDGPWLVQQRRYESLMMAALNYSRPDMVETLLELGQARVDPLQTRWAGWWHSGVLPCLPSVKLLKQSDRRFRSLT